MRQGFRLVSALLIAAAAVTVGASVSSAGLAESDDGPRIDRKPRVDSVSIADRKGRDKLLILARLDNPLNSRRNPDSVIVPADAQHAARVRIVLRRGDRVVARLRASREALPLHSFRKVIRVPLAASLPTRLESLDKRGDEEPDVTYSAKIVQELSTSGGDTIDQATASQSGSLGPGPVEPGSLIQQFYVAQGRHPESFVLRVDTSGLTPKVDNFTDANSSCTSTVGPGGIGYEGYVTSGGGIDLRTGKFSANGDLGWGWIAGVESDRPSSFSGSFSRDGLTGKVTTRGDSWSHFPPQLNCGYDGKTVKLQAAYTDPDD